MNNAKALQKYSYPQWKLIQDKYRVVKEQRLSSETKKNIIYSKRSAIFLTKLGRLSKQHKEMSLCIDRYNNDYYDMNYISELSRRANKRFQETKSKFYIQRLLDIIFANLHLHQLKLMVCESFIIHILAGRGSGKTYGLTVMALKKVLIEPNVKIAIVNKDDEQVNNVNFRPMIELIKKCIGEEGHDAIIKKVYNSANKRCIVFVNGSQIDFLSSEAGSGAGEKFRGREYLAILFDEFEFYGVDINHLLSAGSPTLRNLEVGGSRQLVFVSSMSTKRNIVRNAASHIHTIDKWFERSKEIILNMLNERKASLNMAESLFDEFCTYGDPIVFDSYFKGKATEELRNTPLHTVYNENGSTEHAMIIDPDFYAPHINYIQADSYDNDHAWGDDASREAMILALPGDNKEVEMHNKLSKEQTYSLWTNSLLSEVGLRINNDMINVIAKLQENGCRTVLLIDPSGTTEVNLEGKCQTGAVLVSVDVKNGLVYLLKDYTVRDSVNLNSNSDINTIIQSVKADGLFKPHQYVNSFGQTEYFQLISKICVEANNNGTKYVKEAIEKYVTGYVDGIDIKSIFLKNIISIANTHKLKKEVRLLELATDYNKLKFVHLYFNDTDIIVKHNKVSNDFYIKEAMMEYSTDKKNRSDKVKNKKLKIDAVDALSFVYRYIKQDHGFKNKKFFSHDHDYDATEIRHLVHEAYGDGIIEDEVSDEDL